MAGNQSKNRINFRLLLLLGAIMLFAGAFVFFFANSFITTEREYAVYSAMEEPGFPVMYAEVDGRNINLMHGHTQDMGYESAADLITPLPENRHLRLHIRPYGSSIHGLSYEIRSLNLQHYIEKTEVTEQSMDENADVIMELPIQNMIQKDTPYLLKIQLDLGEQVVNYYTRIIWTNMESVSRMLTTAVDFTTKTFDYNAARDLTVYLETDDTGDNQSYARTGIKSTFSQLTWGQSGMEPASSPEICMREYDGIMGAVEVQYETVSPNESGSPDRYRCSDNFTMRYGTERIYMMNYERRVHQIFEGNKHLFAGKRINLGIADESRLQTMKSENARYLAFKSDRELWSYDQTAKRAVNIFSFRSEQDRLRAGFDHHDVKILRVGNDGSVDFVVYGYMNRGRHEGSNGLVCYRYNSADETIAELCFIPIAHSYERIREDLSELLTESDGGMLYFKQNDTVRAIDLTSLEMLDVVGGLTEGRYAVSRNQTMLAWIDGDRYGQNAIKLMDLLSGSTQTISASEGTVLSVVGFYNQDLLYGVSGENDRWIVGSRTKSLPLSKLMIVDSRLSVVMDYQKRGLYLDNIRIEGDRIHLGLYKKGAEPNVYQFSSRDTIVSREPQENVYTRDISRGVSETRKELCYVDLDENIRTTRNLSVSAPKRISYERSENIELAQQKPSDGMEFYAYGNGEMLGKRTRLADAMDLCFDRMGWVTDRCGAVLYNRADRTNTRIIPDPFAAAQPMILQLGTFAGNKITDDGYAILDAQDAEFNRLLYYIGKGCPVLAWDAQDRYCLIYGYDQTSIRIYDPASEDTASETRTMTMEEAAMYFAARQNNYICFTKYKGA